MSQGVAPERRREIYRETARALASLHSANVDAVGLGNYGRRNDYCKRQVNYFIWLTVKPCSWSLLCLDMLLYFKEICYICIENWTWVDALNSYLCTIKVETLKRLSTPFGSLKVWVCPGSILNWRHLSLPFPMPISGFHFSISYHQPCYCTRTQKKA